MSGPRVCGQALPSSRPRRLQRISSEARQHDRARLHPSTQMPVRERRSPRRKRLRSDSTPCCPERDVTDSELQTLAQLLAGLGITLNITDAEGHLLLSGPTPREPSSELPRTVSMNLSDGRRLVLVPDAETE